MTRHLLGPVWMPTQGLLQSHSPSQEDNHWFWLYCSPPWPSLPPLYLINFTHLRGGGGGDKDCGLQRSTNFCNLKPFSMRKKTLLLMSSALPITFSYPIGWMYQVCWMMLWTSWTVGDSLFHRISPVSPFRCGKHSLIYTLLYMLYNVNTYFCGGTKTQLFLSRENV